MIIESLSGFPKMMEFHAPTKTIFGFHAASSAADEVKALGGTRVLVVTDGVLARLGVIRPVLDSLDSIGIPYSVFDAVQPNAPTRLVLEAYEMLRSQKCDLVIGVGGGSCMDTAKVVSLMATNGSDIASYFGVEKVEKPGIPRITVPTTNVAGADSSFACILTTDERTREHAVILSHFALPTVVIVDPLLTESMPPSLTADTGVDVLVTAIEAYISPMSNPFSDMFGEKIVELCGKYLPTAYAEGANLEARYYMAFCSTACGPLFMSSSIGAIHSLSQRIAEVLRLSHGRSLASIAPAVIRHNLSGCPEKFSRIANLLGKPTAGLSPLAGAELAVEAVENIFDAIAVPHRLRDYGAQGKDLVALAEVAYGRARARLLQTNPRDMTLDDVKAIFEAAF